MKYLACGKVQFEIFIYLLLDIYDINFDRILLSIQKTSYLGFSHGWYWIVLLFSRSN